MPVTADPALVEQRIVEAAAALPAYGGVTGWAALRWAGGRWFSGSRANGELLPVWLATGEADIRPQPGFCVSAERLDPRDLCLLNGLRMTSLVRSVCFEMRYASNDRLAVVALDMAAFNDLVSIREAHEYAGEHSGWKGIGRCRGAIPRADENSWSPPEVLMRLGWTEDAGMPRPLCNAPLFDLDGRHIGTPDLVDPVAGVIGEYDGVWHLADARRDRDLEREAGFRAHGLEGATMVRGDLADPTAFVQRLTAAYDRASDIPDARRTWTLEQPDWWVDTSTVDARRALDDLQREIWLRHRRAW